MAEAAAGPQPDPTLRRRILVTAGAVAVALVGARVPLPFVDTAALAEASRFAAGPGTSVLALGLSPFVTAAVLVELVALVLGLVAPRWRRLRHGSAEGRAALTTWSWRLALVLAAVQAYGLTRYLRQARGAYGAPVLQPELLPSLAVALALLGGALLLPRLALAAGQHGLGNGFAVLAAAEFLELLAGALPRMASALRAGSTDELNLSVLLVVLILVAAASVRMLRGPASGPRVPVPTCSLLPIPLATAALLVPAAIAAALPWPGLAERATDWLRGDAVLVLQPLATLAIALLLARLFCPGIAVLGAWARSDPEGFDTGQAGAVRAALRRGHARSLALVVALAAAPGLLTRVASAPFYLGSASLASLVMVIAVALDLRDEARARAGGQPLALAHQLHVVHAVEPILAALARAGIPALARTRHFRALYQFFAPYAPIEILVPPDRAVEADAICTRVVCGGDEPALLPEPAAAGAR